MKALTFGASLLLLLQAQLSFAEQTTTVTVASVTIVEKPSFTTTLNNIQVTNTPKMAQATTSKVQASSSQAGYSHAASGSPNGVDAAAGAAGTDNSSYSLSTGGLIAVVVVVAAVVIFGSEYMRWPLQPPPHY